MMCNTSDNHSFILLTFEFLFCNGSYIFILYQVGTGVTNLLINARKAIDKSYAVEAEDLPILSTSVAYGVYISVSSNLRYTYFHTTL